MEPPEIAGWLIREAIRLDGMRYTEAAARWPMSLPTLNRMMAGQQVGLTFYRVAERELGLPWRFFDHILNGDVESVRAAAVPAELVPLRDAAVAEMAGEEPPKPKRARR